MYTKIKFLFFLTLFISNTLFPEEVVLIEKNLEEKDLSNKIYLLEEEKKLKIEDILNTQNTLAWKLNESGSPNFGFSKESYWAKVSLKNTLEVDAYYLLEIDFARLDSIDFYTQVDGKMEKYSSGTLVPFRERKFKHRNPVFEIKIPSKQVSLFYFQFESKTTLQFPLLLYSKQKFNEKVSKEQLLLGIHFGIVILSILYGIFLFRLMKDWSNLLFSIYSLSILFVFLIMTGIGFQYFWEKNPEINHFNSFAILLSVAFGLQFSRVILNLPKYSFLTNKLLNWVTVIILFFFLILFFIPYETGLKIAMFATILAIVLIVSSGIITSLKKYKPGIYILIASLFALIEWSIRILQHFAVINFDLSFTDTVLVRCFERIILCLSLIAKVQVIKEENEANQTKRLEDEFEIQERLSRINAEMEVQVRNRTKDLEKEKDTAIRANRLKDNFITIVSHDLKSPILNTKNLLDILIQKEEMDWEERLYYLQNCQSELISSYQLIYNILNLDRFESGNIEITYQYVNLNSILEKVLLDSEYSYKHKKINIEVAANEDLIVIGDSQLLFQMFFNLISNAIKFSYENSKIKITVTEIKNYLQISIQDFGLGLTEFEISNLNSQHFFSNPGTSGEIGTGFGMRIILQILTLHDGFLEIESNSKNGSIFSIQLPCHDKIAICFSEENQFYEDLKSQSRELEIRMIRIYDFKNLFKSIQYLTPDYLLFGLSSKNGKSYQELISISLSFLLIPTFIQLYTDSLESFSDLSFSKLTQNPFDQNLHLALKKFLTEES